MAVPTPIQELPDPIRKLIGDIADKEQVYLGLDLRLAKSKMHGPAEAKRWWRMGS